jgi:hypothetical protein
VRPKLNHITIAAILFLTFGCSHHYSPSAAIRAVGPTGRNWYRPPQPLWRFAITNTGSSILLWSSVVEAPNPNLDYSNAGGFIEWPEGFLSPGDGVLTNMLVPAGSNVLWRASLEFWPVRSKDLKKYQKEAAHLNISATEICPRPEKTKRVYHDEWHH